MKGRTHKVKTSIGRIVDVGEQEWTCCPGAARVPVLTLRPALLLEPQPSAQPTDELLIFSLRTASYFPRKFIFLIHGT